jgi:predicted nucleic acid-binding protein
MDTWLIDTALFKSLGPSSPQRSSLRSWIEANEAPLFLSAASLVELEAAIDKIPASQAERAGALRKWLSDLVATFGDRIHPVDVQVAHRAGALLRYCTGGVVRHRFHDALLAATAQVHGHGILTKREAVFGGWTQVSVASP